MKYRVRYAPRSRRDLERIRDYLTAESKSLEIAQKWIATLLNACDALDTLPQRYPAYPYAKPWHMMPVGNYLVFFSVEGTDVHIGHVRHAARRPFAG